MSEPKPQWRIESEHLELARKLAHDHALRTPLVPLPPPDAAPLEPTSRVWLKLESEQKTGSFKVRGALTKLASLDADERAAGVVTASAGNHGMGIAHAAKALGISARVYIPSGTPDIKRLGIARLGAEVRVTEEPGYDATEALARADEDGRVFVSPYDDPFVAAGNGGSIAWELLDSLPALTTVVLPVGGGGLLAGLAAGMGEREVRLIGVQSELSDAMTRSLSSGETVTEMDAVDTLAEGLEGGVSSTTHALALEAGVEMATVSEAEIAMAMRYARKKLGRTLEGSAATALAYALRERDSFRGDVVVLLTGSNVDAKIMDTIGQGADTSKRVGNDSASEPPENTGKVSRSIDALTADDEVS